MLGMLGILLLTFLMLTGCSARTNAGPQAAPDLAGVFPADGAVTGWNISQKMETYNRDNLFGLVDGQADSFFLYGFEKAAVQRYQNDTGILLNVEIWQLATNADAYGLFSTGRVGSPASFGNEADTDPGRRLAFWQNRFFVNVNATEPVPDETLSAFARAIAGALPTGGVVPTIVTRLPLTGLVARSDVFFHEEMSIQTEVWLGGENMLGLSQATNGVVARYETGDATVRLMLIEYPDAGQASKGLKALQSGKVSDLVAADARGNLLGAVIGKANAGQAQKLLQEALK